MSSRWAEHQSSLAPRFFLATVGQACVCILLSVGLAQALGAPPPTKRLSLPGAFQVATLFLFLGSWFLHKAHGWVRLEKQKEFRRSLLLGLGSAVLFVSTQTYGLWGFVKGTVDYHDPQLNSHGFVFMFTALHAMHFVVAQSVLLWVTMAAFRDRYDHEYYLGVTFASWFWHVLGVAWLAILWVFTIAS